MTETTLGVRTGHRLDPDPSRVVARLFVPGHELGGGSESRVSDVVARLLALDEVDVEDALADIHRRFGDRHRSLSEIFERHFARVADRLPAGGGRLSAARRELLGATFTHEYAIEAAALCNPSMTVHPGQRGAPTGGVRFVMSVRGIGEGHRSSIGFRQGTIDRDGTVAIAPPAGLPILGTVSDASHDRDAFHGRLRELGMDDENAALVLDGLDDRFTTADVERATQRLEGQGDIRSHASVTAGHLRDIAARSYRVRFPPGDDISERVLWPATAAESQGIEDARFVRFVEDDGTTIYRATYTAFDGSTISQQLLETEDFVTFESSPMVGPAAANKGLALFPRRIGGRYAALSRFDRETNAITFSHNPRRWDRAALLQIPQEPWEMLQLGNCGSPIETDAGWLVLTHGVGPMRTYSIGALLLDLDDPTQVIGRLRHPVLTPAEGERDGYVPNVVYSCGGLLHGGTLVIPYGIADSSIGVATVPIADLLTALADTHPARLPAGRPG